ncbi:MULTISPECIES: porin family protein [unclassified Mucilaginibacter]|uniref:porin family protein n=1 Tax=unclassified Mucilaginibacter TaxID=2617802 RepID=UPI002AC89F75|nr:MULTISPECIES: porin family protein [unclassified Mucilaginibacter]MEB0260863.1 porin family protein [Mucilaginibacter sp. 10I4]MEB0278453.1 porin family protein [Mucilaginibacter sp. 10B2]MEB0303124.1 porin family protein [Mucilaginibacter sp. 5C4]WPX24097.1 porin family protein [Mucilaginibacter sp. 5C4]
MKKCLLSVAILFMAAISAKAQFSLGAKAGVNFSKISTNNVGESTVAGYQAGLFARFGKSLYLQPELYVASSGGKFDFNNSGGTVTSNGKVTFTSINVPLLLGKGFGGENLNFRIMAGPVYSYLMDKNQNFSDNVSGAYNDFGNYKKSTLGYQVGGGVDIGHITADLRYEGGLTKINESYGQRQNIWALSVGFKFF